MEEGKFYTWSLEQILTTLQDPAETDLLQMTYHPPESGSFNGAIILQKMDQDHVLAERAVLTSAELRTALRRVHKKLLAARSKRIHPSTDDKVIVSRNALALRAFSESAFCLSNSEYLKIARQNATSPFDHLYKEKQFYRSWRAGQAHHPAYLEDYAGLSVALSGRPGCSLVSNGSRNDRSNVVKVFRS